MIKKLIIGAIIVGFFVLIALYVIPWGNYKSDLVKSDLDEVEVVIDSSGQAIPTLDELEGVYVAESADEFSVAELLFEIDGLKETKGTFEEFSVWFEIIDDYKNSELEIVIETATVNTNNKMRDESLVSDEFFDVEKFPYIKFNSTSIHFKDSVYTTNGALTLMGNSNDLSFDFKHVGSGTDKNKSDFEAFEGDFEFDRTEFGMPEEGGVGNIVHISFYCELIKTEPVELAE